MVGGKTKKNKNRRPKTRNHIMSGLLMSIRFWEYLKQVDSIRKLSARSSFLDHSGDTKFHDSGCFGDPGAFELINNKAKGTVTEHGLDCGLQIAKGQ